jgi:O-antigen/teichoic acid export membrane protein
MTADTPPLDNSLDPTLPHRSLAALDATLPARPRNDKSRGLSLRRNFSWTFLGSLFYAGTQGLLMVLLSKMSGPEAVGKFSLGLGVTAPIILFTSMQLRSVQATDARREYSPGHYLALRLLMTMFGIGVVALIAFTTGYTAEKAAVVMIIGLAKGVETISDVLFGLLQQRERLDYIAKSTMIKGVVALLAMITTVAVTQSIVWGCFALITSWAAVLLFYDVPAVREMATLTMNTPGGITPEEALTPRWEWRRLARLAWLSLPLGFVMMMISLNNNIPTYFMDHYQSESDLGIFSVIQYLMLAGTTVVMSLGQSAIPRLAHYYADAQVKPFIGLAFKLLAVSLVMAIAGILVALIGGKQLLTLIFTEEFAKDEHILVLGMLAAGISYLASFAGYTITAARLFRIQPFLFALTAVVTFIACAALIPQDAVRGGIWVMVITNLVQLIGSLMITAYAVWRIRETAKGKAAYA